MTGIVTPSRGSEETGRFTCVKSRVSDNWLTKSSFKALFTGSLKKMAIAFSASIERRTTLLSSPPPITPITPPRAGVYIGRAFIARDRRGSLHSL